MHGILALPTSDQEDEYAAGHTAMQCILKLVKEEEAAGKSLLEVAPIGRHFKMVDADYSNLCHRAVLRSKDIEEVEADDPNNQGQKIKFLQVKDGVVLFQSTKIEAVVVRPEWFRLALGLNSTSGVMRFVSSKNLVLLVTGSSPDDRCTKEVMISQFKQGMDSLLESVLMKWRVEIHGIDKVQNGRGELPKEISNFLKIHWSSFQEALIPRFSDDAGRNHSSELPNDVKMHLTHFGLGAIKINNVPGLALQYHTIRLADCPPKDADNYCVIMYGTPEIAATYNYQGEEGFRTGEEYAKAYLNEMLTQGIWNWLQETNVTTRVRKVIKNLAATACMYFRAFGEHFKDRLPGGLNNLNHAVSAMRNAICDLYRIYRPGLWRNPGEAGNKDWQWFTKITEDDLFYPLRNKKRQIPIWLADRVIEDMEAAHPNHQFERQPRNFKLAPKVSEC
jgi:hypothetical protein